MSETDAPKPADEANPEEAAAEAVSDTAAAPDEPALTDELSNEELAGQRILEMESELQALRDQTLRTHADMENLRRRTEREMRDAKQYAVSKFAKDVLGVADNLDRALNALPADARASGDDHISSLIDGIEMTQRELINALQKHGVKPIDAEGGRFDPNLHEALFEVPNKEVPNNTVVQVVETGYTIGDRVLRPARVGVAKGGPKVTANQAENAGPGASVDRTA